MTGGRDDRLYKAARRLADCWDRNIGPPPKQAWYDEHQGMEQALIAFGRYVNAIEGQGSGDRYIRLARFLLDCRYHTAAGPHEQIEYCQAHLPVIEQYEAVGHAVRAAYTYSAMADIAMETRDTDYLSAVKSLWASITHRKLYLTGGIGSGETSEGFGPDYSLPVRGYCESCASCGELLFQWKVGRLFQDARCADLYEDTLYNALPGALDLECRHYYYDNPLEERIARYRWHVCPCCVGNIPRILLMLPRWIYLRSGDAIFVNLFVGCRGRIENIAGTNVELVQDTRYPWSGKVALTVNPARPAHFRLCIRVPNRNASALYRAEPSLPPPVIRLNGGRLNPPVRNGYAVLERPWRSGDRVEIELPLVPQRVRADERVAALRGKVALRYGPLVYNMERHEQELEGALPAQAPIEAEWREDLLGGVMVLHSRFASGGALTAIPNYARMNREPGTEYPARPADPAGASLPKSIVWIREQGGG
ncbi:MAG: glycoside hydrolase family 127 protein, partial [Bryobacteraceae bacterium]